MAGLDDAKDVTGRTFLATGNTVQLLSWQSQVICQRQHRGAFSVADIGEAVGKLRQVAKRHSADSRPFE